MDFDFTTETITPDTTSVLTIGGPGALELPSGTTGQQPVSVVAGALRWNTTVPQLEYYDGSIWTTFGGGSVTSVNLTQPAAGITVSGGPITTSGSITLALANDLAAVEGLSTNGIATRTATDTWTTRTITGTASRLTVTNGDGVSGNPTLDISTSYVGQATITTLGTITNGTWNGTTIAVGNGGTGATTFTTNGVLFGNAASAVGVTAAGTTGQVLVATTGSAPTWSTLSGISVTSFSAGTTGFTPNSATTGAVTLAGILNLASGGTNANLTAVNGGVVYSTASAMAISAAGTSNQVLQSNGAAAPTWTSTPTITGTNFTGIPNGALTNSSITVTGGTGLGVSGSPVSLGGTVTLSNTGVTSAIGTTNQVNVSGATGAVTFSLPQSINTTATPTFNQVTITNSPVNGTDAANKNYVDAAIAGLSWKQVVRAATTVAGTLLTSFANGNTIDGITLATGDRILIKDQVTQSENGIYTVNLAGAPTRATDADSGPELVGASVYVDSGTVNIDTGWVQTTLAPITIGSSNIVWQQFSGSSTYVAGTGLTLTGNTFSLTSPVLVSLGGTGLTSTPTNGQIDIGNGTNFTRTTLTQGTGITITNGSGSITIANAGVTTFSAGTTGLTPNSATSGAVTLAGTLIVGNGGTGATTLTNHGVLLGQGTSAIVATSVGATGTVLAGNTGADPTFQTLSGIAVTTISFGTTGLTPASATSGAITVAGTLVAVNGGTGQNTYAVGDILYASTTTALSKLADVATGNALISGGVNTAPSWGKIGLTTHVSGILPLANGGTNANLTAVNGGVVYSTASAFGITAAGTSGQLLTSTGAGAPTWSSSTGSAFTAVVTPNTLVSGNYYSNTITHSLGTNNIVVTVYDNSNQTVVIPHALVQTDTNNLRITVIGNTRTYRVVIIANGASIQSGGSTPSSIIVQNDGVTLTGSPFTTVNLAPGLVATNTGAGVATVTPANATIRTITYLATSLDSPNNSDWTVNALAATVADPTNNAINVRSFANTPEQGVGFLMTIPTGATQMTVTYKGHAQVAGAGAAVNMQLRFYTRAVGALTPAAVGSWSAATNLTSQAVPTGNIFWQSYSQTIALSSFSTALVAGQLYQFELTRNVGVANNLAQNWLLGELTISFA